jgi:hypothetical protein
MLAPMIREKPAAIEKNAVAEEMSRMMVGEVKGTLQHEPDPATCLLLFAIIRWPVPRKKRPLQPKETPRIFPRGSYPADAHAVKLNWCSQGPFHRDSAPFRSAKGNPG